MQSAADLPATIYYALQAVRDIEKTRDDFRAGWATFLQAIVDSGLACGWDVAGSERAVLVRCS